VALVVLSGGLLRFDLTLIPVALGTLIAIGVLGRGLERAFPGALPGSVAAAALVVVVSLWWFRALRRRVPLDQ